MDGGTGWIGRADALARLGVKTQTLYAYVSRGRITARPDPADPRRSQYASSDIERLIRGETAPHVEKAAARGEAELLTSLGAEADGRPHYRGHDVVTLAETATLEQTARLLWGAEGLQPFAELRPRVDLFTAGTIRSRVFATLARRAGEAGPRAGDDPAAMVAEAAVALNEAVDAASGPGPRSHFHQRLARGWKMVERDAHLLRRALVLCADGRMSAAILATRTAASGGACMAGAALAGLTTLGTAELMRRTQAATAFVVAARRDPQTRLDDGASTDDPRGPSLLAALSLPADLEAVRRRVEDDSGRAADLPLALALTARALDLPREAAVDLVLIGRLTGLLGHALDQRRSGSPIRARVRYVGPRPGAN
ncbi:MAG TPA: citrate/2-methylcitrate synthase [Brevundimonas sp.]|jgi:citrate synthase|uniref:citrate/2-methylcitrate synthase n=1 Tax=Brevundimonas sp. TaxID=1871086 RepID=UPI002DF164D8|nr:citrate/2-methylcitrate synthase [Brevundimonas sp.]